VREPGNDGLTIRQLPGAAARGLIAIYRYTLSPLLGPTCRHLPSCSEYAEEAFGRFGFWAGGWMTLARLLRCQPWGTSGLDFVPRTAPMQARWWLPWRYGVWRGTNAAPPEGGAS
jgi:putative membrane protein insertion efficiency factor